jgi:hypothetical protein
MTSKEKKRILILYKNDIYDVSSLSFSEIRNNESDYYKYYTEKLLQFQLVKPINFFRIVINSENGEKFLVKVFIDKLYGIYYFFDSKIKKQKNN